MRIYITSWKRGHDALSINKIESVIKCVGFPCGSAVKESACNAGDRGSIPGLGRSPREGTGYPPIPVFLGFPGGSAGIESTCNVGDLGLIPGLGRSPEEENDCHCREKTTKIL